MTDSSLISLRYYLSLTEAREGFNVASQSPNGHAKLLIQLICVLIVLWGFWLGVDRGGLYFMILGGMFLALQISFQTIIFPALFKRQYSKQQIATTQQGMDIDLTAQTITLLHADQREYLRFADVVSAQKYQHIYLFSFNSGMLGIVPRGAVQDANEVERFERAFNIV